MGRIAIVKGGEVRPLAGGLWRAACNACEMGALFDTEAEACAAFEEHFANCHPKLTALQTRCAPSPVRSGE